MFPPNDQSSEPCWRRQQQHRLQQHVGVMTGTESEQETLSTDNDTTFTQEFVFIRRTRALDPFLESAKTEAVLPPRDIMLILIYQTHFDEHRKCF